MRAFSERATKFYTYCNTLRLAHPCVSGLLLLSASLRVLTLGAGDSSGAASDTQLRRRERALELESTCCM